MKHGILFFGFFAFFECSQLSGMGGVEAGDNFLQFSHTPNQCFAFFTVTPYVFSHLPFFRIFQSSLGREGENQGTLLSHFRNPQTKFTHVYCTNSCFRMFRFFRTFPSPLGREGVKQGTLFFTLTHAVPGHPKHYKHHLTYVKAVASRQNTSLP